MRIRRTVCLFLAAILSVCLIACRSATTFGSVCSNGHDLVYHKRVEATCESDGKIAYAECSRCHRLFDEAGERVSLESLILPAACRPDGVWKSDETKHSQTCLVCGKDTLVEKHKFEEGVCKVCGFEKAGSCQHRGGTATCLEKAVCEICGKPYGKLGTHDFSLEIASDETFVKAATCLAGAIYYKTCSFCGKIGNEATFVVGAPNPQGHRFLPDLGGSDENEHLLVCSICGLSKFETHVSDHSGNCEDFANCLVCGLLCPASPHVFELQIVTDDRLATPATCTSQATYFYSCKNCSKIGKTTFAFGPLADHHFENGVCTICGAEEE